MPGLLPLWLQPVRQAQLRNPGPTGYFIFDDAGADAGTVYWDQTGAAEPTPSPS